MPLSINVGLSRKAAKDFQSTGYSINVTAELDQSLLARPDELQQQIQGLYAQAEAALSRQARLPGRQQHQTARHPDGNGRSNGDFNGNGYDQPSDSGQVQRRSRGGQMTDSQRRAITAIARRINADPAYEALEIVGKELDVLTIRDASQLIDYLKTLQPRTPAGR